jgi:uncharacterized damage-inducible protein DinB
MKQFVFGVLLLGVAVPLSAVRMHAADCDIVGPLRVQYEITRNLVLGMANAIPEAKYDFKPTPEVRTFRDQLIHLINENNNYAGLAAGETLGDPKRFDNLKSRAEILKTLKESYDHGTKVLANMTNEQANDIISISPQAPTGLRGLKRARWAIMIAVMLDNMDHYGNLVVYSRLNNIVPPRTAERNAAQQAPPAAK